VTRAQAITMGTAAAAVALTIAALLLPGYRENRRLASINSEITRVDPEVRAVESVLRELERKRRLVATIQSLETSAVRPLPVLRELTELVPNDAWLTTLSLDSKGVELTGQAAAASALIPILENSGRLERVEFSSPVTRGRDREQFRIRAAWEAGGAAAPVTTATVPAAPTAPVRPPGAPAPARGRAPTVAPAPPTAAGDVDTPAPAIVDTQPAPQPRRPVSPNRPEPRP
jgi:hypothetical protein